MKRARTNDAPASNGTALIVATQSDTAATLSSFAALWREGRFCDVHVQVDSGECFAAHRIVLAAGSDFFKALFSSDMREGSSDTVTISEIDATTMRDVLNWIYHQRLEATPSSLASVMSAASRLEVSSLLQRSADFLVSSLTPATCVASWAVANSFARPELDELATKCERLATLRFQTLEHVEQLSPTQLKAVLASDQLQGSEEHLFTSLLNWLQQRSPPLDAAAKLELFSLVRYPFMAPAFLVGTVEGALSAVPGCEKLLLEAYRHKSLPSALQQLSPRTKPRLSLFPTGVQRSLPGTFLELWNCHLDVPYTHHTSAADIEGVPEEATHVFVGARAPDGTIALGACGRRAEVLQRTSEDDETHEENGVFWYFQTDESFGFSRVATVKLSSADILETTGEEGGYYRLSWHVDGESGGYRAGAVRENLPVPLAVVPEDEIDENEIDSSWRKLLYWI